MDETATPTEPNGTANPTPAVPPPFESAKRLLVLACGVVVGGLAIAGSFDPGAGGVVLLAGWGMGVLALHRLGRAGSPRGID